MAKRLTPHGKMKELLGRLARVPKSEIDAEAACEKSDRMIFPRETRKPGQIVPIMKRRTGS